MRKAFPFFVLLFVALSASAQTDTTVTARPVLRPLDNRSKDHFMLQIGGAFWNNRPDSIRTTGFSRTLNMYVMLDFPFRTNPHFSVAIGPGFSTDHIFLDKINAGIAGTSQRLFFDDVSDTAHFKKYKVATAFLEAPVELRYSSNPEANGKSIKAAIGARVGTMLAAWVKGKELQNRGNTTINDYTLKEKSKRYFNTTRVSLTGRIGYGHFTGFVTYSLTPVFKEGLAPDMNAMSIGLTLSGL